MLAAEREEVLRIRDAGEADHDVLDQVMGSARPRGVHARPASSDRDEAAREGQLLPPEPRGGACEHLRDAPDDVRPADAPRAARTACARARRWVHLRLCLTCGNVGCCDSSVGKHADRHFHETGHPVMRSFEPGEAWRWCYVDDLLG